MLSSAAATITEFVVVVFVSAADALGCGGGSRTLIIPLYISCWVGERLGWYSFVCSFLYVLFPLLVNYFFPFPLCSSGHTHFALFVCLVFFVEAKSFQEVSFFVCSFVFLKAFWGFDFVRSSSSSSLRSSCFLLFLCICEVWRYPQTPEEQLL